MPLLPYDYLHHVNCPEVVTISDNITVLKWGKFWESEATHLFHFGRLSMPKAVLDRLAVAVVVEKHLDEPGGNCIKISLPGISIHRDYFGRILK